MSRFNYPSFDRGAPWGVSKQSGNVRGWSKFGLDAYFEI